MFHLCMPDVFFVFRTSQRFRMNEKENFIIINKLNVLAVNVLIWNQTIILVVVSIPFSYVLSAATFSIINIGISFNLLIIINKYELFSVSIPNKILEITQFICSWKTLPHILSDSHKIKIKIFETHKNTHTHTTYRAQNKPIIL